MKLITNYMLDDNLRHKLNELTQETFYFDFEYWVTRGYFKGEYIPYSYLENDKIIANASANIMTFLLGDKIKKYIQIGTVMTKKEYRNNHLASNLINYIINEYKDKCDGIYLFGDISALEFYRKFGFQEVSETKYYLKEKYINSNKTMSFDIVKENDIELINKYLDYVENAIPYGYFDQINKFGLHMFYTQDFNNIYYSKKLDAFIILEHEENSLKLLSVITKRYIPLNEIISNIDIPYSNFELGFTPQKEDQIMFDTQSYNGGEDYRLFIMGDDLKNIEVEKLIFPTFSHA